MKIPLGPELRAQYRFGLAGASQADEIEKIIRPNPGRVLNVGCGPFGEQMNNIAAIADWVLGIDNSHSAVCSSRSLVFRSDARFVAGDALALPVTSSAFQYYLGLGLIAYINDDQLIRLFDEAFRVIRPTGALFFTASALRSAPAVVSAATKAGLSLVLERRDPCPSALKIGERYMWVFERP
jgi:ubiquinone/menaquinone biosynthesis C-methylase UbiE